MTDKNAQYPKEIYAVVHDGMYGDGEFDVETTADVEQLIVWGNSGTEVGCYKFTGVKKFRGVVQEVQE